MVAKLLEPANNNIKGLLSEWGLPARPCDICCTTAALLYCRADATFLCGACDAKIHASTYHERVWMCEVCEQAPAVVTCKADKALLCSSCDHEIHSANLLARRHKRVPVVPFIDSSMTTANSTFLIPNEPVATIPAPVKGSVGVDFDDYYDAEALLIPNPNSSFSESYLVDYDTKKQKQELTQCNANLRFKDTRNEFLDIHFSLKPDDNNQQVYSSFNYSPPHSISSSDDAIVPKSYENSTLEVSHSVCNSVTNTVVGDGSAIAVGVALEPVLDRKARVLRYREKRKNRKFEKTIRYASRKAYAETRPRIKGRFVKRMNNGNELSDLSIMFGSDFNSDLSFMLDQEYAVVPTF